MTLRYLRTLLATTLLLAAALTAHAQTANTWTGQADTNWNNPANWSLARVPGACHDVVIPAGVPRFPTLQGDVYIQTLELGGDARLYTNDFDIYLEVALPFSVLAQGGVMACGPGAVLPLTARVSGGDTATYTYTWTGPAGDTLGRNAGAYPDTLTVNTAQTGVKADSANTVVFFRAGFAVNAGADYTAVVTGFSSNPARQVATQAGVYTLTVTDPLTGCSLSDTARVSYTAGPQLTLAYATDSLSCLRDSIRLLATVSPAGTPVQWSGPGLPGTAADSVYARAAGTYTATVAASGCIVSESVTIVRHVTQPVITLPTIDTLPCAASLVLRPVVMPARATLRWTGPGIAGHVTADTLVVTTAGTYLLTVTHPTSGCVDTASVRVVANPDCAPPADTSCFVFIKAVDAANKETARLPRGTGANLWGNLTLSAVDWDSAGYWNNGATRQWLLPDNSTVTAMTLSAHQMGTYAVTLTKQGRSCQASIILTGTSCHAGDTTYACNPNAPKLVIPDDPAHYLQNLTPGDTIFAGDFIAIVLQVDGGSPATGWTGLAKVKVPYLGGAELSAAFTNAKVNDCYELISGSRIETVFDPSAGGILDIDEFIGDIKDLLSESETISLATAMEAYYKSLLDQAKGIYTGDPAAAAAFLSDMIAAITANSPGANLEFPTDLTAVVNAMVAGNSQEAAELLAAANGSTTMATDDFNLEVMDKYRTVADALLPKEGEQCSAAPAPMVAGDFEEPANGRLAANEYTGLFIAPDGRAVQLPAGAKPLFITFNNAYPPPPTGTLQGFELSDGRKYFAQIFPGYSNVKFLGYRLLKIPFCEADYQIDIYTGTASEAYFFEEFNEDGRCGYRLVEGPYNFQPTGDGSLIGSVVPASGDLIETWTRKPGSCPEGTGWITGADGIKRKTIAQAGSRFYLEDSNGNITVKGEWKGSGKCLACKAVAEQALQDALSKARSGNSGKLTEKTVVIPATEKGYGPAGSVFYTQMRLEDIIKNLAETYNSLLENVKVPTAAWQPGGKFYVRDETAVISGAIDQGLEELRDIPELVGLGLAFVSDPDGAYGQLQTFAQQMDWEKAQSIGVEIARGAVFADEFEKGGKYALHATGRAGVVLAKAAAAGGLLIIVKDAPNKLKIAADILKDWIVDLTKIRKINGRFPINSQMYAGKKYSFDVDQNLPLQAKNAGVIPASTKSRLAALHVTYPNGVDFDEFGFPRFEPYTVEVNNRLAKVTIQTNGNRNADFSAADAELGINKIYRDENELTWHHVEDTKTMILVPTDIHDQVKHTGGIGVYKNNISLDE